MDIKPGHFPPEFYADLPFSVRSKICRCVSKSGWTRDPKTDWWVCEKCHKPSRFSAVRFCENCETPFVPLVFPGYPATDWADSCVNCHSRPGYNVEVEGSELP